MKYLLPILLVSFLMACKKEQGLPQLSFTNEERQWMIYQTGQQFKFKNDQGDSLVYTVTNVEHNSHTPQYKDTSWAIEAYTESYYAKLDAGNDSIIIYLYKYWLQTSYRDNNKLKQFIRWISVKNQNVELAAIESNAPLTSRTVNGKTYTRVTAALPPWDMVYPFTKFDRAYYDQQSGFIEIIDLNGVSWKRV
jgi:hypothetical protein